MIYVGAPYWHKDPAIRYLRTLEASKYTKHLMAQGIMAYSPMAHGHNVQNVNLKSVEESVWLDHGLFFLRHCTALHIIKLLGYTKSKGLKAELALAAELNIPVVYVEKDSY